MHFVQQFGLDFGIVEFHLLLVRAPLERGAHLDRRAERLLVEVVNKAVVARLHRRRGLLSAQESKKKNRHTASKCAPLVTLASGRIFYPRCTQEHNLLELLHILAAPRVRYRLGRMAGHRRKRTGRGQHLVRMQLPRVEPGRRLALIRVVADTRIAGDRRQRQIEVCVARRRSEQQAGYVRVNDAETVGDNWREASHTNQAMRRVLLLMRAQHTQLDKSYLEHSTITDAARVQKVNQSEPKRTESKKQRHCVGS